MRSKNKILAKKYIVQIWVIYFLLESAQLHF